MAAGEYPGAAEARPLVVVCGLGRFGLRVVERLRERGAGVAVITDEGTRSDRIRRAESLGATVHVGDFRFAELRQRAGVERARAVVLVTASDEANLEAALEVRHEAPGVRIVMRSEEGRFADRLQADFGIDTVLAPAVLAAREFAAAAREEAPPSLPQSPRAAPERGATRTRRRRHGLADRYDPRRPVQHVGQRLIVLFLIAVAVFHTTLGLSWIDSVYFTAAIVTTVGFGDIHLLEAPTPLKLFGALLMFSGITTVAVLSSVLTNFYLTGGAQRIRAEQAARRARGHVIVCGLGSVGRQTAEDLTAQGVPVVIIDATPDDDLARWAVEEARIPLIVGDAIRPQVLLRAGFERARAVVSAVSNDAVSLEIGLSAQSLAEEVRPHRPLRIVLRVFDADLARRIHALSASYTLLSSAEIAAPIFADTAVGAADVPVPRE